MVKRLIWASAVIHRASTLSSARRIPLRVAEIVASKAKQIERRAGYIPVGGVLRNIANTHGLLIGDAAGAFHHSPQVDWTLHASLRLRGKGRC